MSEPIYNSAGEVLYPGLAGDGAGYRGSRLVTLTPEGWEEAEGTWPLMQAAPVPEAKTGYVALGSYPDSYGAAAQEAGCPAYCEAQDGFVRFYARAKPSGDIRVQVTLLGEAGGAAVAGPVAGSGVRVDPTLTLSGAAADAAAVGGIVLPRVVVQTEAGSSIVLSDGEKDVSGVAADGSFSAALPHDGEWTVTATLGTGAATETVQAEYCRTKTLTLTYYTLTVTVNAGSAVTARCGDKTVTGTVPESGSIKLYLPIAGTWTVTAALGGETTEGSVEVSEYRDYPLELAYVHIYGASWDGTSTTKWSRTDEAAEFTDPVPYVAGASSYGSPFDTLQPWAGMVKSERTGGTMVSIPKFWYKLTQNGRGMSIQIADRKVAGFSVSPAHADRGDGKGERDYVYIGRYKCASDYKSKTGTLPKTSTTYEKFRSGIHALGSTIWQQDFAMFWTIRMLYLVEYADWDGQKVIGSNCGNNSGTQSMGTTDSMTYHTGTMQSSRSTYGVGVQYRWIEDPWGNALEWCDGIYFSGSGVYCIKNPANFSDGSGGTKVGSRPTSGGYISGLNVPKAEGYEYALYPSAVNGSESTYIADYCYYNYDGGVLYVGGSYDQNSKNGPFYLDGHYTASSSNPQIGSRLQELPNN